MMVSDQLIKIFNFISCNYPEPWQIGFQNPMTEMMRGIIDLHHDIFAFLTLVLIFVSAILFSIIMLFAEKNTKQYQYLCTVGPLLYFAKNKLTMTKAFGQACWEVFVHGTFGKRDDEALFTKISAELANAGTFRFHNIMKFHTKHNWTHNTTLEIVWTIVPTLILLFIATPSFALIYAMDEILDPAITVRIIGKQWYWTYDISVKYTGQYPFLFGLRESSEDERYWCKEAFQPFDPGFVFQMSDLRRFDYPVFCDLDSDGYPIPREPKTKLEVIEKQFYAFNQYILSDKLNIRTPYSLRHGATRPVIDGKYDLVDLSKYGQYNKQVNPEQIHSGTLGYNVVALVPGTGRIEIYKEWNGSTRVGNQKILIPLLYSVLNDKTRTLNTESMINYRMPRMHDIPVPLLRSNYDYTKQNYYFPLQSKPDLLQELSALDYVVSRFQRLSFYLNVCEDAIKAELMAQRTCALKAQLRAELIDSQEHLHNLTAYICIFKSALLNSVIPLLKRQESELKLPYMSEEIGNQILALSTSDLAMQLHAARTNHILEAAKAHQDIYIDYGRVKREVRDKAGYVSYIMTEPAYPDFNIATRLTVSFPTTPYGDRGFDLPYQYYDSYLLPEDSLQPGQFRLLEVDAGLEIPHKTNIRLLVTAGDVLHSWALPSCGIKVDAIPGRLNEQFLNIIQDGILYGQCSEICGVNHGFMPIKVSVFSLYEYTEKLKNYIRRSGYKNIHITPEQEFYQMLMLRKLQALYNYKDDDLLSLARTIYLSPNSQLHSFMECNYPMAKHYAGLVDYATQWIVGTVEGHADPVIELQQIHEYLRSIFSPEELKQYTLPTLDDVIKSQQKACFVATNDPIDPLNLYSPDVYSDLPDELKSDEYLVEKLRDAYETYFYYHRRNADIVVKSYKRSWTEKQKKFEAAQALNVIQKLLTLLNQRAYCEAVILQNHAKTVLKISNN
jgi:heme/copper-type cytochrome/quinol oxidase subunit 2